MFNDMLIFNRLMFAWSLTKMSLNREKIDHFP